MCADDDVDFAGGEILEGLFLLGLGAETADQVGPHRKGCKPALERLHVLKRQHCRRRENGNLLAVHRGFECGAHGDFGLSVSDVAAQQAIHRRGGLHVCLDVGHRRFLVRGQLPLERVFELLLPVGIRAEGVARHRPARGVELEQLLGHVAHGLLDPRLRLLPRRAAKLVERGTRGAGELLNEIEALDGDKELVFAEVAELHELLRLHAELDPLQSHEHADPVIDVHDEIPDLQVAEVGEEGARRRAAALVRLSLFLEDVRFGPELQARIRQTEPAREMAYGDEHRGRP